MRSMTHRTALAALLAALLPVAAAGILLAAAAAPESPAATTVASPTAPTSLPGSTARPTREAALAAFDTVQKVLQHPRCQNCHIPGDAPLQFDAGLTHAQNVQRGPQGAGAAGLPCSTCHSTTNPPPSYGAHTPPGAPNWKLPPPERKMVFINLSKGDLCANLKDPKRNGGRDMAALIEHVDHDKLVLWGWNPGVGRAPVAVAHGTFVANFKTWAAGGAPCPPPSKPAPSATPARTSR